MDDDGLRRLLESSARVSAEAFWRTYQPMSGRLLSALIFAALALIITGFAAAGLYIRSLITPAP